MFPLFEVLDYQLLKVGSLCLYKNKTILEDRTNAFTYTAWKAECHFPFCT